MIAKRDPEPLGTELRRLVRAYRFDDIIAAIDVSEPPLFQNRER